MDLEKFLNSSYKTQSFEIFISEKFYGFESQDTQEEDDDLSESEKHHIKSYRFLGQVELDDDSEIGFFEFVSTSSQIENKRVGYGNVLKKLAKDYMLDGAIASFYHPESNIWRLSFVGFEYDEGKANVTNLKRYTYVLGKDIPHKTAYTQLKKIKYPSFEEIEEAFGVEKVSQEFYEKYKKLFEMLNEYIKDGQYNYFNLKEEQLHSFSKKLLGRIVFLYFLQKKGWLGVDVDNEWGNGDKFFLFNAFKSKQYSNFYEDFLKKIFFNALNNKRNNDFFELTNNRIPFLNGGLFEKDRFDDIKNLNLENRLFEKIFRTFNEYNFTIIEDSPDDKEVAIDPEMMGRVFENLLEENYRKGHGAFYTPREIVHYMCQQSIVNYLATYFPNREKIVDLVVDKVADDDYFLQYGQDLKKQLLNIRIIDPAIGSGAFPMGMLHEIVTVLQHLDKTQSPQEIAKLKRSVIEKSIYGVDIDASAVEVAKLRFWLSLVVDEETPTPLPNLYYKIMVGNSLLESINGFDPLSKDVTTLFDESEDKIDEVQTLLHEFYKSNEHNKKIALKNKIEDSIDEILQKKLSDQESIIKSQIENVHLFNGLNKKQLTIIEEAQETRAIIEKIKKRPTTELFFYKIYFSEVLAQGGFDVVIGNPPYIRQEKIKALKPRLENEFFYNQVSKKDEKYECFKGTADIYIYFFEKGFKLLKENAVLSFITSNKYTRAKYGQKFRKFLLQNTQIVEYIDFNGVRVFESATVDTSILSFKKVNAVNSKLIYCDVDKSYKKGEDLAQFVAKEGFEYSQGDLSEEGFSFANPKELAIKKRIEEIGTPLKEWDAKISYGIKTGFNEAFIIDGKEKDALIKQDAKSAEIIKPLLRGRDIGKYSYEFADKWLISTFPALNINIENYPAVKEYLEKFLPKLKQTSEVYTDENGDIQKCRKKTGNKWFETQDQIAYWEEFEKEKIVWASVGVSEYAYIPSGMYLLDTNYFMELKNTYILALLNSKLLITYNNQKDTQVGASAYRHYKYNLKETPIPKIIKDIQKYFEQIVSNIIQLKIKKDIKATFFERVIDIMVYELYFKKELHEKGFGILDVIAEDLALKLSAEELYSKWTDIKHPVKYNVDFIDTVEVVKTIEESL